MASIKRKRSRKAKNENPRPPSFQGTETGKAEEGNNKTTNPQIQEANAQKEKKKMPTTWTSKDIIQTVIYGLTGLGTIGTVLVVYFMTSQQNRLSEQSLLAAKRSIELTDSSYIVQNRAYILSQIPTRTVLLDGTEAVSIPLVNYGKTPAYNLCMDIKYRHCDTILNHPRNLVYSKTKWEKILAPQYPDTEYVPHDPDTTYWRKKGKYYLVFGKIWYTDFVGQQHFTTFAYYWEFRRGKKFAVYPGFDSTDEYQ